VADAIAVGDALGERVPWAVPALSLPHADRTIALSSARANAVCETVLTTVLTESSIGALSSARATRPATARDSAIRARMVGSRRPYSVISAHTSSK
jgi:hypothetical protein